MYWKKVVQMKDYITMDLQKQEGTLCTGFIWEGTGGGCQHGTENNSIGPL